jgi:hypothetical protein
VLIDGDGGRLRQPADVLPAPHAPGQPIAGAGTLAADASAAQLNCEAVAAIKDTA